MIMAITLAVGMVMMMVMVMINKVMILMTLIMLVTIRFLILVTMLINNWGNATGELNALISLSAACKPGKLVFTFVISDKPSKTCFCMVLKYCFGTCKHLILKLTVLLKCWKTIQEICWYKYILLHVRDKLFKNSTLISKKIQKFHNNT